MRVRNPIVNAATVLGGTTALSLLLAGGVRAQTSPDHSGAKSGETAKSGDAAKPGSTEIDAKFKDVKITINADRENVRETLRAILTSARADFVIDDDLKAGTATVHFKEVPFKDALTTLIKVSTIPIAYEVKDGVFHFMRRVDPPVEEKPVEPVAPVRPRYQSGSVPLQQATPAYVLRKLSGAYDTPPATLYQHSSLPLSHGSTTTFGLSGSGLFQSNTIRNNPDGSVSRSGTPPINLLGLLRGLLGGLR